MSATPSHEIVTHDDAEHLQLLPPDELPRLLRRQQRSIDVQARPSSDYSNGTKVDDDGECRTPTSDKHKIPIMKRCPPAPRKIYMQPMVSRCNYCGKRKLLSRQLDFFQIVGIAGNYDIESINGDDDQTTTTTTTTASFIKRRKRSSA